MANREGETKYFITAVFSVLLGSVAILIGWIGYGGFIFGIPAIILGCLSYKKHRVLSLIGIIFGCIGFAETIAAMILVSMLNELSNELNRSLNESLKELEQVFVGNSINITSLKFTEYGGVVVSLSQPYNGSLAEVIFYNPNGKIMGRDLIFSGDTSSTFYLDIGNICNFVGGKYTLTITSFNKTLFNKTFHFDGPKLDITSINTTLDVSEDGLYIKNISIKMKNTGDLPAVISGFRIKIEDKEILENITEVLLPSSERTFILGFYPWEDILLVKKEKYLVKIEALDNCGNLIIRKSVVKRTVLPSYNLGEEIEISKNIVLSVISVNESKYLIEEYCCPLYRMWENRSGFKWVLVRYKERNTGNNPKYSYSIWNAYLITDNLSVYKEKSESLYLLKDYYNLIKEIDEPSEDEKKYLCENVFGMILPDEEKEGCVVFEIRTNETPKYLVISNSYNTFIFNISK